MLRNAFCWRFYSDEEKIRFLLYLVDMCLFVRQTIVFVWYENSILHARHMHIAILLSFTQHPGWRSLIKFGKRKIAFAPYSSMHEKDELGMVML